MGRRKLEMKLIPEKRARMLTLKKRKEGLMKKIEELTTLCDVKACMIIYCPDQQHPEIYPKDNLHQTCGIIEDYKEKKRDLCKMKSFGLSCYFKEREKEIEKKLVSLRNKNIKSKYPTWNSELESERDPLVLRRLAGQLSVKTQIVKSRIELLKNLKKQESEHQFPPFSDMTSSSSSTSNTQQNTSRGGFFMPGTQMIVNYDPQVALQQVALTNDDGSDYYWQSPLNFPMNVDDGGSDYLNFPMNVDDCGSDYLLPALPQSYVSFPGLDQSYHQSEGDNLQLQPYMITDDEVSQYLLPFY